MQHVSRSGEKGKSRELQVRCRCESCGFTGPQILAGLQEGSGISSFTKGKHPKVHKRKELHTLLLSGEKGGPSKMVDS